jgi:hypothetical protein
LGSPISNPSTKPEENAVIGADFVSKIDDQHIELAGQAAFSAYNSDISSGNFTDAHIDSVYTNDPMSIKNARDILQKYITVNDNLRPLSFKKLSTLAYDMSLGANYFDNVLKIAYQFRGSDYNSFGQTFLRKDIRGFNISDRIRLANNQVFATVGYEQLEDNTSDTKVATTTFSNFNMALSYYSRTNVPDITIGFARFGNNNGLSNTDPDSLKRSSVVDDGTDRFFLQGSYDFLLATRHTATLNFSTSSRNDNSLRKSDVKNLAIAFGLTTRYTIPLQTNVEVAINKNDLPSATPPGTTTSFNYSTLTLGGRYSLMKEALVFTGSVSPTIGDVKRTVVEAGTQWHALPTMSFLLQYSYFNNQGLLHDDIWSLQYRYDL